MTLSIFDPGATLALDFSELDIDLEQRAFDRLFFQFKNSVVLRDYLFTRVNAVGSLRDVAQDVIETRTLDNARGEVLDVLGAIIGQPRIDLNAEARQWFGPDVLNDDLGPPDRTPAYVLGGPLFGRALADDVQYLQLILAKIFKNHVYGSTIPELIRFISFFSSTPASVVTVGPMEVSVLIPPEFPLNVLLTLLTVFDDNAADRQYLLPVAATVRIVGVTFRPSTPFAPDRMDTAPDIGAAAVNLTLEQIEEIS
ncbi:MAG: DUF2612 domain-containing protein [Rhodobacteraceae bacterium]|nr:DUF2612 domain-containing protein [Paracoccaceae bacterium]